MQALKRQLRAFSVFTLSVFVAASAHAGALLSVDSSREKPAREASAIGFTPADAEAQEQGIVGFLEIPIDGSMADDLVGEEMAAARTQSFGGTRSRTRRRRVTVARRTSTRVRTIGVGGRAATPGDE